MARSSSKSNLGGLPEPLVARRDRVCPAPSREPGCPSRQMTESGRFEGDNILPVGLACDDWLVGDGFVGVTGQSNCEINRERADL